MAEFNWPKFLAQQPLPTILHTYHDSVLGGHSRYLRTYKRLMGELYWEGIKHDVKIYRNECIVCQCNKSLTLSPVELLKPLEVQDVWGDISMDSIDGLPKVARYDVILKVVDRLSKYVHFLAFKHLYKAKSVAEGFVKEIVRL